MTIQAQPACGYCHKPYDPEHPERRRFIKGEAPYCSIQCMQLDASATSLITDVMDKMDAARKAQIIIDPFEGEKTDVSTVPDAELLDMLAAWDDRRQNYNEHFAIAERSIKDVIETRLRASGAKGIAHPAYVCELDEEFGPAIVDLEKLREAQGYLKPTETPVVKHVPEFRPDPIPAHDEAAGWTTIKATIARYAGQPVAALLQAGFVRPSLGSRLKFRRVKTPPKQVTPQAIEETQSA